MRGQGLGIPWPLLGCPCPLRGKLNVPKSTGSSSTRLSRRWTWSSTEAFQNFTHFHVELDLGIFENEPLVSGSRRRGNLDIIPTSPLFSASTRGALCLVRQWTCTASVWVLLDVLPTFSARRGTRILKSIPVLLSSLRPRGTEKCAQSMLQLWFLPEFL